MRYKTWRAVPLAVHTHAVATTPTRSAHSPQACQAGRCTRTTVAQPRLDAEGAEPRARTAPQPQGPAGPAGPAALASAPAAGSPRGVPLGRAAAARGLAGPREPSAVGLRGRRGPAGGRPRARGRPDGVGQQHCGGRAVAMVCKDRSHFREFY